LNNLLQLKGKFEQASSNSRPGAPKLPAGKSVKVKQLENLLSNLIELKEYWIKQQLLPGALISVCYNKIAAKSNRIQGLLGKGAYTPNKSIVGARFSLDGSPKHIITHYISHDILDESIFRLRNCILILKKEFNNEINEETITKINKKLIPFSPKSIAKTNFLKVIVDAYYVEKFDVLIDDVSFKNDTIITLYKTNVRTQKLLSDIGINILSNRIMDETTVLLRPDELEILKAKAPFLISMAVSDLSEITKDSFDFVDEGIITIPSPKNEPTIGVIDTLFDENVYFSKWVQYTRMLSGDIGTTLQDYEHGTAVSSIIVDGPSFNPNLDDGCGRFKVKHFGVAIGGQFN